jgi:hypothetical protein
MSSSTTHVQCGSGLSPKCTHPGVYSSDTPGIILCGSCAQLNLYASALRKIDLQRANQFNAAAGGVAGLQFGAPTVTGTAEDYSEEGGVIPVIHSLLNARTVLQIPAGYGDNFVFTAPAGFPGVACILGNIAYTVRDFDDAMQKEFISSFRLPFISGDEGAGFPVGIDLPIGIFLHPARGHDSWPVRSSRPSSVPLFVLGPSRKRV